MTAGFFEAVERIFHEARRLDSSDRPEYLQRACGDDPALRREVESLLSEHDRPSSGFMNEPALGNGFQVGEAEAIAAPAPLPGRIGRYEVRRLLGEGGMGVVYLAEQAGTGRAVALKIIRPGFASPSFLRRFEHEAQVLGRLRHPGIALVHEAGVHQDAAGRFPYIAMEYVKGPTLTEYARRAKLDTRQKLELLIKICDAVQHAHQKGVIHRDLKPGNVLVDETTDGQPKILDFGVARLTDADVRTTTLKTDMGQLLGTVQYMSPEQASGDPHAIDTRSDVYALGVIGYELLTGALPYDLDDAMILDAVRIIQEVEPRPLSAIDRVFRGDLDTILSMTLDKDKTRRYQSAAALADDIRRYLRDEPITAHRPSALYQVRKFTRRNRTLVGSATVLLVFLVSGIIITSWLAVAATRARAAAQLRFDEVHKLANVFMFEFDELIEHLAGSLPARRLIVETGLEYLDRLAAEARDDPELRVDVAAGYVRLGDIQGGQMRSNLGDTVAARESYAKAVDLLEYAPEASTRARIELLSAYRKLAGIDQELNNVVQEMEHLRKAERVGTDLVAESPDAQEPRALLAGVLERIADSQRHQGQVEEGLRTLRRSHALRTALLDENPDDPDHLRQMAVDEFQIGLFQLDAEEYGGAVETFQSFVRLNERLAEADPANERYQRDLRVSLDRLGEALMALDRPEEALVAVQRALAIAEANLARSPQNADALTGVSIEACRVGELQLAFGRLDDARAAFDRELDAAQTRVRADPASSYAQRELGVALYKMGEFHTAVADLQTDDAARTAQWGEARTWFQRCYDKFVEIRDEGLLWPSDAGVLDDIAEQIAGCEAALSRLVP